MAFQQFVIVMIPRASTIRDRPPCARNNRAFRSRKIRSRRIYESRRWPIAKMVKMPVIITITGCWKSQRNGVLDIGSVPALFPAIRNSDDTAASTIRDRPPCARNNRAFRSRKILRANFTKRKARLFRAHGGRSRMVDAADCRHYYELLESRDDTFSISVPAPAISWMPAVSGAVAKFDLLENHPAPARTRQIPPSPSPARPACHSRKKQCSSCPIQVGQTAHTAPRAISNCAISGRPAATPPVCRSACKCGS